MAKLYFYYSAMNAGKSTTLLQSSYNYREKGMQTLLFSPAIDTRFERPLIYSRIGLTQESISFDAELNFLATTKNTLENQKNLQCILIDEAQFLKKNQVKQLTQITTDLHIPVLCYGLRSDFQGEPFEGSQYLLAWAQELVEIKTICHCGRKATMNLRVDANGNPIEEGDQIQIGGNESYQSVCMLHFRENNQTFSQSKDLSAIVNH